MEITKLEPGKYRYGWKRSQQSPMPRYERVGAPLVRDRDSFISKTSNRPASTHRKPNSSIVATATVARSGASVARAKARAALWS